MTTIHEPADTRLWSTVELSALIGRHVSISIARNDNHSEQPKSWAGVVDDAGILRSGSAYIDLRPAGGPVWDRDWDEMRIEVHESGNEGDR